MNKIKLLLVVGARPNYIKITQFKKVADSDFKGVFDIKLVHTGQHFDAEMADVFFKQLGIQPDFFLNIPQASPNLQMVEIMIRLEALFNGKFKPDFILVPGDVNSTLAAALTANKIEIKLGHLESGLRSFDKSMPEEINRILVDEISDYYFVTETSGLNNLLAEGKPKEAIHFVGNSMIDTLVAHENGILSQNTIIDYGLTAGHYILMTIPRPVTVDNLGGLKKLLELISKVTRYNKVVFPMHPRTKRNIETLGLTDTFNQINRLTITGPLDYFQFRNLVHHSKVILIDSGGIQEEATFKKIPCLTLRPNTERPSTIEIGSNTLLNFEIEDILQEVNSISEGTYKTSEVHALWDGLATNRILEILTTINFED